MANSRLLQRLATAEAIGNVRLRRFVAVIAFAVLTALAAFMAVRIPGMPVPITLQTLFVSLAGLLLGPRLGAMAKATYVTAGAAGLPVFAGGALGFAYLFGPTGGYLLAFPLAAYVTGTLVDRTDTRGWLGALRMTVAVFIGTLVVFAGGFAQLAALTGDPAMALRVGVLPFLFGDVVKVVLAVVIARRLGSPIRRLL
jgi:biotin transport system substrate-specific component